MSERTETLQDPEPSGDDPASRPGIVVLYSEAPLAGDAAYTGRAEVSIGRSADRDIFVEDAGMSRLHASVRFKGTSITIEDRGSRNGTFVDGAALEAGERRPLQEARYQWLWASSWRTSRKLAFSTMAPQPAPVPGSARSAVPLGEAV